MTDSGKDQEAIDIVRRVRDGKFSDNELDAMLERLTDLFGDHNINTLHVPEDAGVYRKGIATAA